MQSHTLQRNTPLKKKKPRVGRGGKRGHTSGRGQKGQKSRAGHRIRPAEREFIQRLPKLRGVKHKPLREKPAVVNVGDLGKYVREDNVVNQKVLGRKVKILGEGSVTKPFMVKGLKVSKSARQKIEAAGGKIL